MNRNASWFVRRIASCPIRIGKKRRKICSSSTSSCMADSVESHPIEESLMNYTNRISQTLHDEHAATVALMERLEQLLARGRRSGPPDKAEGNVVRLLSDLAAGLEAEVERHFAFEEDHIFTYLE